MLKPSFESPCAPCFRDEALLCIYYPQQLLPGLASIEELRLRFGRPRCARVAAFIWSDPGLGEESLARRKESFEKLLQSFPWVELIFPSSEIMRARFSPNFRVAHKSRHMRSLLEGDEFGSVHFAHDISSDYLAQTAMVAYPKALRVCFGDALGVFYTNDYYTRLTYPIDGCGGWLMSPKINFINLMWRLKRYYTLPCPANRLDAQIAIPILASDPGGDFLPGKELMPVSRQVLTDVLSRLEKGVDIELPVDIEKRHLMLLGSFSESGFIDEFSECAMYMHVLKKTVPEGQSITLKAHPASSLEKIERIVGEISKHCPVAIVDCAAVPVEVVSDVSRFRTIISFSYSSIALHYLHGCHVVHAMTDELIDAYFPLHIQNWMKDSNDLYLAQLSVAIEIRKQQALKGLIPKDVSRDA